MRTKHGYVWGLIVVVCSVFMVMQVSYGFNEKHLQQLKQATKCPKCDLSNAKLTGLDLSYADLSGADLSGADLTDVTLYGAILAGANLTKANLSGANLYDADLSRAIIKDTNFSKANLYNAIWPDGKRCRQGSTGTCK